MKATPLISSTLASAVVFLLTKLAVIAMASFPRNSLRLKPAEVGEEKQKNKKRVQTFQIIYYFLKLVNQYKSIENTIHKASLCLFQ